MKSQPKVPVDRGTEGSRKRCLFCSSRLGITRMLLACGKRAGWGTEPCAISRWGNVKTSSEGKTGVAAHLHLSFSCGYDGVVGWLAVEN